MEEEFLSHTIFYDLHVRMVTLLVVALEIVNMEHRVTLSLNNLNG